MLSPLGLPGQRELEGYPLGGGAAHLYRLLTTEFLDQIAKPFPRARGPGVRSSESQTSPQSRSISKAIRAASTGW